MKNLNVFIGLLILLVFFLVSCPMQTSDSGGGKKKKKKKHTVIVYPEPKPEPDPNLNPNPIKPVDIKVNLNVESFTTTAGIIIKWNSNDNADGYIIYKDTVPNGEFKTKVYEGLYLISYTDTNNNNENEKFYYYKIACKKDSTIYEKSDYSFGMFSKDKEKDDYDDNDDSDHATILDSGTHNANIFHYEDGIGNILVDTDWYSVNVPAKSEVSIIIGDFNNIVDEDLNYMVEEDSIEYPISAVNNEFMISNTEELDKQVKFKVSANMNQFIDKFGSYNITVE